MKPSIPPRPTPGKVAGKPCWKTRWRGAIDPATGQRPVYIKRWYNMTESQAMAAYGVWLQRWMADPTIQDPRQIGTHPLVAHLCHAYMQHCLATYNKRGRATSHIHKTRAALDRLEQALGKTPIAAVTTPAIAAWRDSLAKTGLSRQYVNDQLHIVQACWQWAAEKGVAPQEQASAISNISPIAAHRSAAKEPRRVAPIAEAIAGETARRLDKHGAAGDLIRILWLTGMRPSEAIDMTPEDLSLEREVWAYTPKSHKTEHTGAIRVVMLGPMAQKIIRPRLPETLTEHIFKQASGKPFTVQLLRRAIHRVCAQPPELPAWNPNQLRHAKATALRKQYGLEAAQAILGHTHASTTERYADKNMELAEKIAKETG